MAVKQIINKFYSTLLQPLIEFLYPPYCILCDASLGENESKVCSRCWNSFTRMQHEDAAYRDLKRKFSAEGIVTDCLAPFIFKQGDRLQDVIHHLKYKGFTTLGIRLGEEIGRQIITDPAFRNADLLIPVPLHRVKIRERGYNQSVFICKGISSITKIPIGISVVQRTKYTTSQTNLDLDQRSENVANAFTVNERYREVLEGKAVILVDDVITTGATVSSCAKELKKFGVAKALTASVAHAF